MIYIVDFGSQVTQLIARRGGGLDGKSMIYKLSLSITFKISPSLVLNITSLLAKLNSFKIIYHQ